MPARTPPDSLDLPQGQTPDDIRRDADLDLADTLLRPRRRKGRALARVRPDDGRNLGDPPLRRAPLVIREDGPPIDPGSKDGGGRIDDKVQQRARVDLLHARQLLGRAEARAPVGDGGRREAEVQHVQGRDVGARAAGLRDDALDDGVVRVGVAVVGGAVAAGGLAPEDDVVRVAAEGRDVVAGPFDAVFVVWSVK